MSVNVRYPMKYLGFVLMILWGIFSANSTLVAGRTARVPQSPQEPPHDSVAHRYSIKSAIITFEVENDGHKSFAAFCFEDYGQKEALESKSYVKADKTFDQIHTLEIYDGDEEYYLDLENRVGVHRKRVKGQRPDKPDFASLTPEMMKTLGLMKNSPVEYMGKLCDSYVLHNERLNIHGKYLVWNNIVVSSEINAAGVMSTTRAVKILENAPVPAKNFEVPLDIVPEEKPE